LRCVPQDEDTGGFFVATLRKIGDIPNRSVATAAPEKTHVTDEFPVIAEDAALSTENAVLVSRKQNNKGLADFQQWDDESFNKVLH
jgi:hypothetical protein